MELQPGQRVTAMRYLGTRSEGEYIGPAPDGIMEPDHRGGRAMRIPRGYVKFEPDDTTEAVRADTIEPVANS